MAFGMSSHFGFPVLGRQFVQCVLECFISSDTKHSISPHSLITGTVGSVLQRTHRQVLHPAFWPFGER